MSGNWATAFFRSQLSDKDGTVSNTKVCLFLIVNYVLVWVSCLVGVYIRYIMMKNGSIGMADITAFLSSVGTFSALLAGVLGGMKYTADAVNNRAPNASPQVQPPDQPPQPKQGA